MRKLLQQIFSHKSIPVVDADTGKNEIATYKHFLGFPLKITYTAA